MERAAAHGDPLRRHHHLFDERRGNEAEDQRHRERDRGGQLERRRDRDVGFASFAQVHRHDEAQVVEHRHGGHQHGDDGEPSESCFDRRGEEEVLAEESGSRRNAAERIDDFEGLSRRAPFWAFAMFVFLLSLGGIPPTAGFLGKYFLFAAAVEAGFGWLAIIAVLMSAVSMFYYLRLVVAMYLREGRDADVAITAPLRFVAAVCLVVTLALGLWPAPLVDGAGVSSHAIAVLSNAGR